MDVEGDFFRVGGPALVAEAVGVFAVSVRGKGVILVRDGLFVVLAVPQGILNLQRDTISLGFTWLSPLTPIPIECPSPWLHPTPTNQNQSSTYPKINLQVSAPPKLPIANLEGHSHQVIAVQGLVEALPRVRLELDGVSGRGGDPAQRADEDGGC